MFSKDFIINKVFDVVTNPDIQETGRTFTEKEVAVIMAIVSVMVGDPSPGENKELYQKLMDHINLPESLHEHMLMMILSARQALKESLIMQEHQMPNLKEIEDFLKNLNAE